jgi:hypothetical protein
VDLGRYLCEVRARQYWRLENLTSFDEFLEKRFPESRRKAYYPMAIHENLTHIPKSRLREVGVSKAAEMAKVARRDGQEFDCANWLHKANELPTQEFRREVERHLTGKSTEAWEVIYFKVYKSQLPVIEQALETAALMLGSDKSRGYMLEMICADFLAGANLDTGNSDALMTSFERLFDSLPQINKQEFLDKAPDDAINSVGTKRPRQRLDRCSYETLRGQVLRRDGWRCQSCGSLRDLQFIICSRAVYSVTMQRRISSHYALGATDERTHDSLAAPSPETYKPHDSASIVESMSNLRTLTLMVCEITRSWRSSCWLLPDESDYLRSMK